MKLNMGCGHSKLEGFVNVDLFPECNPDVVCDLEKLPWPWETGSATQVLFNHSLEHLGADSRTFLEMMKELYRISANGCMIHINAPHPRHDNFINDPTHVRIITPELLALFSKRQNEEWKRLGAANSPLALYLHVDFELVSATRILNEPYFSLYNSKRISDAELATMIKEKNNIVTEYKIVIKAVK